MSGKRRRNLRVDAIDGWPLHGQPSGAEHPVYEWENERKIVIAMLIVRVMPVVKGRG